jgi:uncharacterized membrane protein YkvA (DUF1232 family)
MLPPMDINHTLQTITASANRYGRRLVELALTLVYAFLDERTPLWARTVILGALAYLLSPLDACADPIPVAGLADDLATLLGALASLAGVVSPEHIQRARRTSTELLG